MFNLKTIDLGIDYVKLEFDLNIDLKYDRYSKLLAVGTSSLLNRLRIPNNGNLIDWEIDLQGQEYK